jgi:hypothetical protein
MSLHVRYGTVCDGDGCRSGRLKGVLLSRQLFPWYSPLPALFSVLMMIDVLELIRPRCPQVLLFLEVAQ